MSLNKVMLIGNVGQDPEVRFLDNTQTKVVRLRLATTERFTDRNGENRENTEWHTVTAWHRQADVIERFVHKGTQIYVEGKLRTREWTDQSGAKRTATEVVADNIQLLGKREGSAESAPATTAGPGGYQPPYQPSTPAPAPAAAPAPKPAAPVMDSADEGSDDLPF